MASQHLINSTAGFQRRGWEGAPVRCFPAARAQPRALAPPRNRKHIPNTMRYESPNPVPAVGSRRLRARHRRARAHRRIPAPPSGTRVRRRATALLIASRLPLGQAGRCENRVGIFGPYSTEAGLGQNEKSRASHRHRSEGSLGAPYAATKHADGHC